VREAARTRRARLFAIEVRDRTRFVKGGCEEEARARAHTARSRPSLELLQAERGASRNTLAAYGADLDNLQAFLARRKRTPAGADTEALRAYLKSLDYVGMTLAHRGAAAVGDPQFYRFLLAERMRDDDPAAALDSPKLGRPLPKVLTRDEVDRLIEATRDKDGADGGAWRPCSRSSTAPACACRSW
jgi:site-specific recombinase XerD